ncbi:MAG TPA: TetR family transcriptional regulator [Caproiciproducens sp.]|jgi:Uncharacterized protein conserved in bacteria|nr:TetR family transcriptional regulator [Caproiciproducens sp.]
MGNEDAAKQLLAAAAELLEEAEKPEEITSRQIAARAGVNLALINYYFQSKDKLLFDAVGKIMERSADSFLAEPKTVIPPKERLRKMLYELCETVVKYQKFTAIYVPHIVLHDDILAPLYILPILREYFGERRTELECRIIAYQMITYMQVAFFRADAFQKYTGLDIMDASVSRELIDMELKLLLGEDNND